jgi:dolichol-phosphate mannosyltransferase
MSLALSVVVPCYNEEDVIQATHDRLAAALSALNRSCEILYVNDGSRDRTLDILTSIAATDSRVRIVNLARNFGHQAAVSAGLEYSSGETIAILDADLQDPPELIGPMLEKRDQGYQVVYGQRIERSGETFFKTVTADLFYRMLNSLSETKIPRNVGDFRLIDRKVAKIVCQMPERHRFLRGMISWVGFRQYAFPYSRDARHAGVTKYPLRKMLHFAMDGIISFSTAPLKLAIWSGLLSAGFAVLLILYAICLRLLTNVWVSGFTLTIIAIAFFSGVQLVALGVIGFYIGRIFEQSKGRPLFVVEGFRGFAETEPQPLSRQSPPPRAP